MFVQLKAKRKSIFLSYLRKQTPELDILCNFIRFSVLFPTQELLLLLRSC